jgi:hypothetical protein
MSCISGINLWDRRASALLFAHEGERDGPHAYDIEVELQLRRQAFVPARLRFHESTRP